MTTVLRGAIAWTLTLMLAFLAAIPSGLSAQRRHPEVVAVGRTST